MQKMTAYCGLICTNCPTYLATQADDDDAREKTVALYEKQFGFKLKPESSPIRKRVAEHSDIMI
jgi:hypothetical protein